MDELTIVIDHWSHKELEEYLMSLNGILDVKIKNDEKLEIYLKYDSTLITSKIIKNGNFIIFRYNENSFYTFF